MLDINIKREVVLMTLNGFTPTEIHNKIKIHRVTINRILTYYLPGSKEEEATDEAEV